MSSDTGDVVESDQNIDEPSDLSAFIDAMEAQVAESVGTHVSECEDSNYEASDDNERALKKKRKMRHASRKKKKKPKKRKRSGGGEGDPNAMNIIDLSSINKEVQLNPFHSNMDSSCNVLSSDNMLNLAKNPLMKKFVNDTVHTLKKSENLLLNRMRYMALTVYELAGCPKTTQKQGHYTNICGILLIVESIISWTRNNTASTTSVLALPCPSNVFRRSKKRNTWEDPVMKLWAKLVDTIGIPIPELDSISVKIRYDGAKYWKATIAKGISALLNFVTECYSDKSRKERLNIINEFFTIGIRDSTGEWHVAPPHQKAAVTLATSLITTFKQPVRNKGKRIKKLKKSDTSDVVPVKSSRKADKKLKLIMTPKDPFIEMQHLSFADADCFDEDDEDDEDDDDDESEDAMEEDDQESEDYDSSELFKG